MRFVWICVCLFMGSGAHAGEYAIFGPGSVTMGAPAVYDALKFNMFASERLTGFWGNPAYGTFADPDRPGPINVYDGTDGSNVTLRLWFMGADFTGLSACIESYSSIGLVGVANVGQPDPCHATHAASWAFYWPSSNGARTYCFKTIQVDASNNIGFGPARGWNPSNAGIPDENVFDLCLEYVPVASTGELRIYGFEKRRFSTDDYHRSGVWTPNDYAWGLTESELDPAIKDPTEVGPQNRYYNRFSGYPYAQLMNVFTGLEHGLPTDYFSWAGVRAEGTPAGENLVNSIGAAKKATLSGIYDIGSTRVTADFRARNNAIYVRQLDRSAGIAVKPYGVTLPSTINIGDRLQATGYTKIEDGAEVVLVANRIVISPSDPQDPPVGPIGISGRSSGGGASGSQTGVLDNALASPAEYSRGVNTVGQLVRMWGNVTATRQLQQNGLSVFWLDDGSKLQDGLGDNATATGIAVGLPPDWVGEPPWGCCVVTGILKAARNPQGKIVRILFPRSAQDIVRP